MIEEDYVSFDIAKLLKEKGFNGQYHMYYVEDGKYTCDDLHDIKDYAKSVAQFDYLHKTKVPAPTLQMAMRWLREVHNLHIVVFRYDNSAFPYIWYIFAHNGDKPHKANSYEEACEAAIKYCLENLI